MCRFGVRVVRARPQLWKRLAGTVSATSLGMFGRGTGWGIPITNNTLDVPIGTIAEKPRVVDGQISIREYLCLTASVDHDIVNGALAARFAIRLKELIKSSYGLAGYSAEP